MLQEDGIPVPPGVAVRFRSTGDGSINEAVTIQGSPVVRLPRAPCRGGLIEVGQRRSDRGGRFERWRSLLLDEETADPAQLRRVDVTIWPVTALEVQVRDDQGTPRPGPRLAGFLLGGGTPGQPAGLSTGPAGADGSWRLFVPDGRYRLVLETDTGAPDAAEVDGRPVPVPVEVELRGTPVVVAYELPESLVLTGTVVSADQGDGETGIPRIRVESRTDGAADGEAQVTWTDPAGSFSLEIGRLPVTVQVVDQAGRLEYEPTSIRVERRDVEPLRFVGREPTGEPVEGMAVTFDEDSGERVLAGLDLVIEPACEAGRHLRAKTDDEGRFRTHCPPCAFSIRAGGRGTPFRELVHQVPADQCDRPQRLELRRAARLVGTVVDHAGNPARRLPLAVGHGASARRVTTDDEGHFELAGVAAGTWIVALDRLRTRGPSGDSVLRWRLRDEGDSGWPVEIVVDEDTSQVELSLEAVPAGQLCVTLTDPDGDPLPLQLLEVHADGLEEPVSSRRASWTERRRRPERLCTEPLAPGQFRLLGDGDHLVPTWWPGVLAPEDAELVTVEPGEVRELEPMEARPAGSLLLVTESPGRRCPELRELPDREQQTPRPWLRLDDERCQAMAGGVLIDSAPMGRWVVRVCGEGDESDESDDCQVSDPFEVRIGERTELEFPEK